MKILICSADEKLREEIKSILSENHDLILTETIDMCHDIVKNTEIRILLIDLSVSDSLKGIELIDKSNLKIVAIANYRSANEGEMSISLGASGYIASPITSEKILSVCK